MRCRNTLYIAKILLWADTYRQRMGRWPNVDSGRIKEPLEALGEHWRNTVDAALRIGLRRLPGGYSLAQLLADHRGVRNPADLPKLTRKQILSWADAHHKRTGTWPTVKSGRVREAPGETWLGLDHALSRGRRGLPARWTLARLLAEYRGVRKQYNLPRLSRKLILAWADMHHRRTGNWPHLASGRVLDAPGETWMAVEMALYKGRRGLPGGSSLHRLLNS